MTSLHLQPGLADTNSGVTVDVARSTGGESLPPGLIYEIEAVVGGDGGPLTRADSILRIVNEIYQTVAWLHDPHDPTEEVASLVQVLRAVQAHEERMAALALNW